MKKLKCILMVAVMVLSMAVPTLAAELDANETALLERLESLAVEVGGETVTVPAEYITQVENYLSSHDDLISDDTLEKLNAIIDNTVALAQENNATQFSDLPEAVRNEIFADINAVAEPLNITVSYDATKGFSIVDGEGEIVFQSTLVASDTGLSADHLAIALMAVVTMLTGCTWFVVKKRGAQTLA